MSRNPAMSVRFLSAACLVGLVNCQNHYVETERSNPAQDSIRTVTVLYTNDEHGWIEGMTPGQGAANLYGLWQQQEGYSPEGPFLVLSGGDNWTGPAVSTWVQGESMVQVMNAMHYAAAAVGNHEFDFGLETLSQRLREADFPYLSSNTRWRENQQVPTELGIQPFSVIEVNDLTIGIIGLTTTSTPRTTNPDNVSQLEFVEYEQALRAFIPRLRASEVDLLFVIAHVCLTQLRELAPRIADLDVHLLGGGHCNELAAERLGNTVLLGGGHHFTAYARAVFQYDTALDRIVDVNYSTRENDAGTNVSAIAEIVNLWQQQTAALMSVVIGYSESGFERRSDRLGQRITDSWLLTDSTVDIAITNAGGIRAALPAGDITMGDVIGILPFENTLIAVNLTGEELKQVLDRGRQPILAGLFRSGDDWILDRNNEPIADQQSYRVLVNSFMYAGGDNYQGIAEFDAAGFDTGISYRQPFLDWIIGQGSSRESPLQF